MQEIALLSYRVLGREGLPLLTLIETPMEQCSACAYSAEGEVPRYV